eukprot:maker-scaffold42_size484952-snap-gene-3.32 protein:Tk06371 transcript:maker-scaffold42_size484952-snap-gene-3.32-mRNA-1 annotation:"hypothetical protein EHEL_021330"
MATERFTLMAYHQLCMYHLTSQIRALAVSANRHLLCVAGDWETELQVDLAIYYIPEKLTTSSTYKEGLLPQRDFAFHAGAREGGQDGTIVQVMFQANAPSTTVILLQSNRISIWSHKRGTDLLEKIHTTDLKCSPPISMKVHEDLIYVLGTNWGLRLNLELKVTGQLDLGSEARLLTFQVDASGLVVVTQPKKVSHYGLDLLEKPETSVLDEAEINVLACDVYSRDRLAFISSDFRLHVAQDRTKPIIQTLADVKSVDGLSWVSADVIQLVSGSRIILFTVDGENVKDIFTHDPHKTLVTDCVHHPKVPNLFFSSDSANRLHAWRFDSGK